MKYVIDVEPTPFTRRTHLNGTEQRWQIRGTNALLTDEEVDGLEVLNAEYVNEHFGDLQEAAFYKGRQYFLDKLKDVLLNG